MFNPTANEIRELVGFIREATALRLRPVCRFCGNPMSLEISSVLLQPGADVRSPIALRGWTDLYAHQRCVDREQGRR